MIKRIGIVIFTLCLLFVAILYGLNKWLEKNLESILNSNPDRSYNISFEKVNVHAFLDGITLKSLLIIPLRTTDTTISVSAKVDYVKIQDLEWKDLILEGKTNLYGILFEKPRIKVELVKIADESYKMRRSIQEMFGDILSRGMMKKFIIRQGNLEAGYKNEPVNIGNIYNLNLEVLEIKTDSIDWQYLIPFKFSEFTSSIDSLRLNISDDMYLKTGLIHFSTSTNQLRLEEFSMAYNRNWLEVSRSMGYQENLFELEIKAFEANYLEALRNIDGKFDLNAKSVLIEELNLRYYLNSSQMVDTDTSNTLFTGLINKIPFPIKLDTINVINSDILYTEFIKSTEEEGMLHLGEIEGKIINVSNYADIEGNGQVISADLTAMLNNHGHMVIALTTPYDRKAFSLHASLGRMNLKELNRSLVPLLGLKIGSGILHKMDFRMDFLDSISENTLVMDYDNLRLNILKKNQEGIRKKEIVSFVTRTVIRNENLPDKKRYRIATYNSAGEINDDPFILIWQSMLEGMSIILPTNTSRILSKNY